MRRILAMLWVSILQVVRDRGELISIVFLPLLLTYVFGVAFGAQGADRPLVVMWEEAELGVYSQQIQDLVDAEESIEVEIATYAEAKKRLDAGETSMIVRVPAGFDRALEAGWPATLKVEQAPDSARGIAAMEVLGGVVARASANAQAAWIVQEIWPGADGRVPGRGLVPPPAYYLEQPEFASVYDIADSFWEPVPPIAVKGVRVTSSDERGDAVLATSNIQYSIGFTIMFVLFMAFGSAGGILEEREQGTLRRLLVTPSTKANILGGKIAGVIGTSTVEALILVGLGAIVFSVPWGRDPLALVLLLGAYILASAGLAVFVTAVVRTRSQLSAIGPIASTGLAMIGGCYWPIEVTPPFMQTLAKFTPTGQGMAGLLDVVARGQGLEAAWQPIVILLAMAAVTFAAGLFFLKID